VEKIEVNGVELMGTTLKHSGITNGGGITFYMCNKPKYKSETIL